jgi:hypothetical protein
MSKDRNINNNNQMSMKSIHPPCASLSPVLSRLTIVSSFSNFEFVDVNGFLLLFLPPLTPRRSR